MLQAVGHIMLHDRFDFHLMHTKRKNKCNLHLSHDDRMPMSSLSAGHSHIHIPCGVCTHPKHAHSKTYILNKNTQARTPARTHTNMHAKYTQSDINTKSRQTAQNTSIPFRRVDSKGVSNHISIQCMGPRLSMGMYVDHPPPTK